MIAMMTAAYRKRAPGSRENACSKAAPAEERVHRGFGIPDDVEKKLAKDAGELAELIGLQDPKILLRRL